jgi:hypothetical protein
MALTISSILFSEIVIFFGSTLIKGEMGISSEQQQQQLL